MSLEKQSLKEIINFRLQKLKKLRESGIDPYPHNFKRSNYSSELKDDFMEKMIDYQLLPDGAKDYTGLYNPFVAPNGSKNPHKLFGYLVQPKLAKELIALLS